MDILTTEFLKFREELQSKSDVLEPDFNLLGHLNSILNSKYCFFAKYKEYLQELNFQVLISGDNNLIDTKDVNKFLIDHLSPIYDECINYENSLNLSRINSNGKLDEIRIPKLNVSINSILAIPLILNKNVIGIIGGINKINSIQFTVENEKSLEVFSLLFALYLDNIRLKEENKTKETLSKLGQSIINSAHGLKNILNNIDGGVFIAEKGTIKKNMDDVTKGWEILRRNSNRVRDLVLDILLYSRPKSPEYQLCNVNNICHDLKELMFTNAESANVKISLDLDNNLKPLYLDPKGIYRCILNLISNAIWACKEKQGGKVTITTIMKEDKLLEIVVSDTGIGISKENLENIFNTFFTTKGSKGTGLGLSVTQKIIKEHNGQINVSSIINEGTQFKITLPIHNDASEFNLTEYS